MLSSPRAGEVPQPLPLTAAPEICRGPSGFSGPLHPCPSAPQHPDPPSASTFPKAPSRFPRVSPHRGMVGKAAGHGWTAGDGPSIPHRTQVVAVVPRGARGRLSSGMLGAQSWGVRDCKAHRKVHVCACKERLCFHLRGLAGMGGQPG